MANLLNKPLCATAYGNTGFSDCFLEPSKIIGAIQVTSGFEIAEGDIADLQEFLTAKAHAAIGTRIFPYHNFVSITDNTEDATINTTDYGAKIFIRDGYYDFTFRYLKGGVQVHQEFAKNQGGGKYFLFYDDNGVLYGYKSGGKLKGIPTEMFLANPWKFPTGAEAAMYTLRFSINPVFLNKGNLGFLKISEFNMFDVPGLQEVSLELDSLASNVATVLAFSKISAVNLHDAFASNLAAVSAWRAEDQAGVTVTITTVTNNTADGGWDITFNSTLFNAADKVYLKLAIPATLRADPILVEGFDTSEALEIEAPAS